MQTPTVDRVHPYLNPECCYWGGLVKGIGFTLRHGWNSCSEFYHLSFNSGCMKQGQGPILLSTFTCCIVQLMQKNGFVLLYVSMCVWVCVCVCREMGSETLLQHFCRQTHYHLPRSLFCQDKTAAASKTSCKTLVTLYVSYLSHFLPQNTAAVVSRAELGEIEKRSPLQCFGLLSC